MSLSTRWLPWSNLNIINGFSCPMLQRASSMCCRVIVTPGTTCTRSARKLQSAGQQRQRRTAQRGTARQGAGGWQHALRGTACHRGNGTQHAGCSWQSVCRCTQSLQVTGVCTCAVCINLSPSAAATNPTPTSNVQSPSAPCAVWHTLPPSPQGHPQGLPNVTNTPPPCQQSGFDPRGAATGAQASSLTHPASCEGPGDLT